MTNFEECAELCRPAGFATQFSQESTAEGGVLSSCLCFMPEPSIEEPGP